MDTGKVRQKWMAKWEVEDGVRRAMEMKGLQDKHALDRQQW